MAKTYLDIVKYMVETKFSINGMVDKPDIIGAVFGQTEGLLGDDLDLRELQKGGKIGRIEIDLQQSNNRSFGKLFLPASLDRIETCILAAAVESVDRVGPYEAQFTVEKVEDTRSSKRQKILLRAKELVKLLLNTEIPDSKELSEMVQSEVRVSEITSFGPEKIPAGPDIAKSPELIIVEGRADVLNLLKNDVTSVLAVGGASAIPQTIVNLCREKEVTVFLDGDRGGDLILRNLLSVADIDYVARAPDGKEVEDLTRKEIIKAIRTKVPLDQYNAASRGRAPLGNSSSQQRDNRDRDRDRPMHREERHEQQSAPVYTPASELRQQQQQREPEPRQSGIQTHGLRGSRHRPHRVGPRQGACPRAGTAEACAGEPGALRARDRAGRPVGLAAQPALRQQRERGEGDPDPRPVALDTELEQRLRHSARRSDNPAARGARPAEEHKGDLRPALEPDAEEAPGHPALHQGAGHDTVANCGLYNHR